MSALQLPRAFAVEPPIDRHALVSRHNIILESIDARNPISIGNGEFAFGADVTGLQTFPQAYEDGIPLCTQSQWGWHSRPIPPGLSADQIRYTNYDAHGRQVGYLTKATGQEQLFNWLRENPHRLHLGRIALDLHHADGSAAAPSDLANIHQTLDLWTGILTSHFDFEGVPVTVETCCAGSRDAVAFKIISDLVGAQRLRVRIAFPGGSPAINAADWDHPEAHKTTLTLAGNDTANFHRQLDADTYDAAIRWQGRAELHEESPHQFLLTPAAGENTFAAVCAFSPGPVAEPLPGIDQAQSASRDFWHDYWTSGGAIDLGAVSDPQAAELERRVVLSQYLVRVNSAGSLPPAETGLTCNSWYGKFHLEMHWWHDVHFALWGRQPLFEKSMDYYQRILPLARQNAHRQGYAGARWPKMVGPDGHDSPSPIAPLLIWQQPHPIYYAELCYRAHPNKETLDHWNQIVNETADFMASYAFKDASGRYVLGPPLKTVPEHTEASTAHDPTFELSYWRFGLRIAQAWRQRQGLPANPQWDDVLNHLLPLPTDQGLYLSEAGMTDTYTKWNWEHPSLLGAYGVLPGDGVDPATMLRSFDKTMQVWQWDKCWGWDFPMVAMCAARLGRGDQAVEALLLKSAKNEYLTNGQNYQRPSLQLYLPGNGGLLTAVAMMAAGWDNCPDRSNPGFPQSWNVRWEGLKRMP